MRDLLSKLWNLRKSPSRVVRFARWAVLVYLITLLFPPMVRRPMLAGFWIATNVSVMLVAVGWWLMHPRAVLPARDVSLRWAFWLTLLTTLTLFSVGDSLLAEHAYLLPAPLPGLAAVLTFLLCPVLFVFLLAVGVMGGAIGAFGGRRRRDTDRLARAGVGAWWIGVAISVMAAFKLNPVNGEALAFPVLFCSAPMLTFWICALTEVPAFDPLRIARGAGNWLAKRLVWRWTRGEKTRTLDMRGAALGLVAACLALVLGNASLLTPIQSAALASLMGIRNALIIQISNPKGADITLTRPKDIVLLEMDASTRRSALTARSEAAIQADMIRKLSQWGASRIVLPLPLLETRWLPPKHYRSLASDGTPDPDDRAVARSIRDLPSLTETVKASGKVLVAMPRLPERQKIEKSVQAHIDRLAEAASAVGQSELSSYHNMKLPAIPTRWEKYPPVPLLLFASAQGPEPTIEPVPGDARLVKIAGRPIPQIAPGQVLVAFLSLRPGSDFPKIAYSSVLNDARLYREEAPILPKHKEMSSPAPETGEDQGKWLSPREYFKAKIVFLDSLDSRTRETPVGTMTLTEATANATATLMAGDFIRTPDRLRVLIGIVLLGMLTGNLCIRRDPLQASWVLSIIVFAVIGITTLGFIFFGMWIDPVVPLVAAVGAYLLVTQFTFSLERSERERNRALLQRFVAPQVVDELLEDPEGKLGLGGKRQPVCVLFADVRGFTRYAEQHTPEEVIEIINTYMTAMTEALHAYGGLLDKYTGDGLMAIFRVTGSPREDIEQAVRAALAMRDAAEAISSRLAAQKRQPLQVGIGMHYGEAVVGLVGNPNQFNYTALGYAVIVSQRLQSIASGGEVIISETIHSEIEGAFYVEEGKPVYVKGISTPVRPYRVNTSENLALLPRNTRN